MQYTVYIQKQVQGRYNNIQEARDLLGVLKLLKYPDPHLCYRNKQGVTVTER